MELKGKKILFLGDSITEGVGVSDPSKIYWNLLAQKDHCVVKGYGIAGTRIAKQQKESENTIWDQTFVSRVPQMDADADVVVIFGGTNDYGHGDAAMGKMENRTEDTFYGAVHHLFQTVREKYNASEIVVMTPCHRINENRQYNEFGLRNVGCLEDYVNAIKEVAGYYSYPVVDLYCTSGMQPEIESNRLCFMPDGLHPSDAGHVLIYQRLRSLLLDL